jgi:hypothetical protein
MVSGEVNNGGAAFGRRLPEHLGEVLVESSFRGVRKVTGEKKDIRPDVGGLKQPEAAEEIVSWVNARRQGPPVC